MVHVHEYSYLSSRDYIHLRPFEVQCAYRLFRQWKLIYHNKAQALPLVVQSDGNEKQIAVQETTKHIKTIDQWVSAFSVFMAVYCQKFKDAAPDLIKYIDTIRNMFKQKGIGIKMI